MGSLFPCLPDDVGWQCLVRVELGSHGNLKGVSKSWNAALKCPEFYEERRKLKISEQRLCMVHRKKSSRKKVVVVYDPEKKSSCKRLPPIPVPIDTRRIVRCHLHFVKQKLVLITDNISGLKRSRTWVYDFSCCEWRKGKRMPTSAIRFACAADEEGGLIYVGGGFRNKGRGDPVRSASVYNVEEDKWDALPDMKINPYMDYYRGVFSDGKFSVRGCQLEPMSFDVFYPSTNTWETLLEDTLNSSRFHFLWPLAAYRGLSSDRGPNYSDRDIGHLTLTVDRHDCDMREAPHKYGEAIDWRDVERPSELNGFVMCAVNLHL